MHVHKVAKRMRLGLTARDTNRGQSEKFLPATPDSARASEGSGREKYPTAPGISQPMEACRDSRKEIRGM